MSAAPTAGHGWYGTGRLLQKPTALARAWWRQGEIAPASRSGPFSASLLSGLALVSTQCAWVQQGRGLRSPTPSSSNCCPPSPGKDGSWSSMTPRLVLAAGGLTEGIACISGTGSIAVGVAGDREERAGGWGYLLGDEGSGYWVVREALRELALRQDTHAPLGPLGAAVMGAARCPDMASLLQRWYDRPSPDEWAALAPLVLDSIDPFGDEIAERTALALASAISAVHVRLGGPQGCRWCWRAACWHSTRTLRRARSEPSGLGSPTRTSGY